MMMSEKRFVTNGYYINDIYHDGRKWLVNEVEAKEIVGVMNNLDMKARERGKALSKLQKSVDEQQVIINDQEQKIGMLQQEIADTQAILEMLSEKLKGWS